MVRVPPLVFVEQLYAESLRPPPNVAPPPNVDDAVWDVMFKMFA